MKRLAAVCVAAVLGLGLQGCGEKQQSSGPRKADAQPYTTATGTHTAAGWKAGDAVGWEKQMTARTQNGQNEYTRTGSR
jgi:hypothetical protein